MPAPDECVRRFEAWDIAPDSREYLRFHARRFSYLVDAVTAAAVRYGASCRILDVGPAFQTALIRDALPQAVVNTLGYDDARFPHRPGEEHFNLDLNDTQYPDRCPTPSVEHDIIVMAEVVEHLYTAPHLVLRYLAGWLRPGGLLLLQTPNAVSLGKRLAILRGRNPFEMIRDQRMNPGHFREYTVDELREVGRQAGFETERVECRSYFGIPTLRTRFCDLLCAAAPGEQREGITIWLHKSNQTKI